MAQPKRSWRTISLRATFVLITLLALPFAWYARVQEEWRAVRRLEKELAERPAQFVWEARLFGTVVPEKSWKHLLASPHIMHLGIFCDKKLNLPSDFYRFARQSKRLTLRGEAITDEVLDQCVSKDLEALHLDYTNVTLGGFATLERCIQLEALEVVDTPGAAPAIFDHLEGWQKLRTLRMNTTPAELASIPTGAAIESIREVYISERPNRFSKEAPLASPRLYGWLSRFRNVERLEINGSDEKDDRFFERLSQECPFLKQLFVQGEFTHVAMTHSQKFPDLESLGLSKCRPGMGYFDSLQNLTNLTRLRIELTEPPSEDMLSELATISLAIDIDLCCSRGRDHACWDRQKDLKTGKMTIIGGFQNGSK